MWVRHVLVLVVGLIVGFLLSKNLSKEPEPRIITKIEFQSDTVYVRKLDTVYIVKTDIKQVVVRDTILTAYTPEIKAYKAMFPLYNGNISVSGEVLGEVLKMNVVSDIKAQAITNTIKETTTIIKKPHGLFVTAGVTKQLGFTPSIGVTLIKDRYLIGISTTDFKLGYKVRK